MRNRARKGTAGEKTKQRLIETAVDLFERYSFDGVSTRNLADKAKVNLASVQYYFGSKEGLYLAVAEHIVERVRSWMAPDLARIDDILKGDNADKETCFELLCELLDRILAHVVSDAEPKRWMGIFLREQIDPSGAFEILYKGVMEPIHSCLSQLIAGILGLPAESQEVKVRAYAIIGPIFVFHLSRAEIGRTLGWQGYGVEEHEAIRRIVFEHTGAVFGMPPHAFQAHLGSSD